MKVYDCKQSITMELSTVGLISYGMRDESWYVVNMNALILIPRKLLSVSRVYTHSIVPPALIVLHTCCHSRCSDVPRLL